MDSFYAPGTFQDEYGVDLGFQDECALSQDKKI